MMLNIGAVPVYADLNFDIAYGPLSDGVIEEKLTYTRVQAMVMGQTVSSGYVNRRNHAPGGWPVAARERGLPPPELLPPICSPSSGRSRGCSACPIILWAWATSGAWSARRYPALPGGRPQDMSATARAAVAFGGRGEGLDPEVGAEEAVEAAEGAEDAPPAEGDEADAEAVPPAEAEGVVEDAEGAENDAAAEPQQQEQPDAADDPLPPSSTFLSQRNRLDNPGPTAPPAAIIRSEMPLIWCAETFFTGVVVDGRIIANRSRPFADTGEMIVRTWSWLRVSDPPRLGQAVSPPRLRPVR